MRFPGSRRLVVAGVAGLAALCAVPAFATIATSQGYDVSWPQCGRALPSDGDFRIVGVNGGKPYTVNDCLKAQYQWARGAPAASFYVNTANPGPASEVVNWYGQKTPSDRCSLSDDGACAFNYGWHGARLAWAYAEEQTGAARRHSWWLDVETANSWDYGKPLVNMASILGAKHYLESQGVPVGVYSTDHQWRRITGGYRLGDAPNWVAGARNGEEAASWCGPDSSFTGGPVVLIQWVQDDLDHNHACAPLPPFKAGGPARALNPLEQLLRDLLIKLGFPA